MACYQPTQHRLNKHLRPLEMHGVARLRHDSAAGVRQPGEHLAGDGLFVCSVLRPTPDLMANEDEDYPWFTYTDAQGHEVRVSGRQTYDPVTQIRTETAVRRWADADGREQKRVAPLALRLTLPDELELLMDENGLMVVERYGDFDRSPLSDSSRHIILLCRRAL